jgi:hypothetical protein
MRPTMGDVQHELRYAISTIGQLLQCAIPVFRANFGLSEKSE